MGKIRPAPFDKYDYYFRSVQDPSDTLGYVARIYKSLTGREARVFGEDFCGTFNLSCFWACQDGHRAIGVDLDPEPIAYGKKHNLAKLEPHEQKRVTILRDDVRSQKLPPVDVIGTFNFSYFIFKRRQDLLEYFENCRRRVGKRGVLMLDCFGGTDTMEPNAEHTELGDFVYHWDQDTFDPITNEAMFYIHFKRKGEKKRERVFTYDWRMWSPAELRDILLEAGFKNVTVYWEGTDDEGQGNNVYTPAKSAENCPAWIAYVVGHP